MPIYEATAVSYAKGAERLLGEDANFLNDNPDMVPQFVNALFQALEISLKEFGNRSCLTNRAETKGGRGGLIGNGHDIEKMGNLLRDRLGNVSTHRLVRVLTDGIENGASVIIEKMIFGKAFAPTGTSYSGRKLVYHEELEDGDVQIVQGVKPWVDAVKAVAENIDNAVALIKGWKDSGLTQSFEEWHVQENGFLYD